MLDKKDIEEMEKYLKIEDSQREELIIRSRSILKASKTAIYCIHRKELDNAKSNIDQAKKIIEELKKITAKYPHLSSHIDGALEEYAEACVFYGFVLNRKIPSRNELNVEPITYLSALSDLTGELGRRSVLSAIAKDKKEVQAIRDLIDEIYGTFIRFDLRNGDLRKKSDSIKWNLSKVEELLHDTLKKK